jgi:hypothetical protein
MANLPASGFTANYTDPGSGITILNAWIQISNILYVPAARCLNVFDVYLNQAAYQQGSTPVFSSRQAEVFYNDINWNTYFDPSVMDLPSSDIQAMSLAYVQAFINPKG